MAPSSKDKTLAPRRSRRQNRPAQKGTATNPSSTSSPPPSLPPPVPLPESELDMWFVCGPFSALCQGATSAEIAQDLKLLHAAIQDLAKILLNSDVSSKSSTLVKSVPRNAPVSVNTSSLSASTASTRRSSRIKVQQSTTAELISPVEPLTPESSSEEPVLKDSVDTPMYDVKKSIEVVGPITCSQWDFAGAVRLRPTKRGQGGVEGYNRIAKQLRWKPLR